MTAVPTYSTLSLVFATGLALVALGIAARLLVWALDVWVGRTPEHPAPPTAAQRERERLVDAAHAWAPTPGEPVTRRTGAA